MDPNVYTTYNARTYLQPQLNKAVRMAERAYSPLTDRNPKDHIIFQTSSCKSDLVGREVQRTGFSAKTVSRDNTGTGTFIPRTPFPTLNFPSDHAIVCAELQLEHHESFWKIEHKLCTKILPIKVLFICIFWWLWVLSSNLLSSITSCRCVNYSKMCLLRTEV